MKLVQGASAGPWPFRLACFSSAFSNAFNASMLLQCLQTHVSWCVISLLVVHSIGPLQDLQETGVPLYYVSTILYFGVYMLPQPFLS